MREPEEIKAKMSELTDKINDLSELKIKHPERANAIRQDMEYFKAAISALRWVLDGE